MPGSTTAASQDTTRPTALPFGPPVGPPDREVRAEAAAKGWAISPWRQKQRAQTGRQGQGSFEHPWGGKMNPSPPPRPVLPNVGREPTSPRTDLVGVARSSVHTSVPGCPKQGPVTLYGPFCGRGSRMEQAGHGGRNEPSQMGSQFPFYKMPSVGGQQ